MRPEKNVDEVDFFRKKHNFGFFSDIELRFQFFGKSYRQKRQHFQEKYLAESKAFRPLGNEQEKAGFVAKNFSWVFNTAFHVSRESLWDKKFFSEKIINWTVFADFEERISEFLGKVFDRVSKLESSWREEHFGKSISGRMNIQLYIISRFFLGNSDLQQNSRFLK